MLNTRRLSNAFGIEILGLDLRQPLATGVAAEVRRLWNENGIVLLRGQEITPQQLIAYSRNFGELDLHETVKPFRHPDHPELFVLSTIPVDGKPSVSENVGRHWHSDLSYTLRPPLGSIFHAQILPDVGGDTVFTSTQAAYEGLSDKLKEVIEGLWAVHDYMGVENMKRRDPALVAQLKAANPPIAQPLVRPHSETGRKCLYLSEQMTSQIVGMSERESRPIMRMLYEHTVDPLYTYRHKWTKNDIIMWDNRSTMHLALADFAPGAHRYCMRTTILGQPSGYVYKGASA
jgi:taurine dioxygenase